MYDILILNDTVHTFYIKKIKLTNLSVIKKESVITWPSEWKVLKVEIMWQQLFETLT